MPIVDYGYLASQSESKLLANESISPANKKRLKAFLAAYDVSSARRNIFCKHIHFLLERTEDIEKDMHDRSTMNRVFQDLRNSVSKAYYTTIANVSLRFVRWLNDGDKPKGFRDIKNSPKKTQRRQLKAQDMILWEEAKRMCKKTHSVQIRAAIMTQLNGGFRPGEFIDLTYGDIRKEKGCMVASVRGKTGDREVLLFKCQPQLQRWVQMHPTKKKNDPLWITEYTSKSSRNRNTTLLKYAYPALSKRFKELGRKAGIAKPLDFYNFRHSCATDYKRDNIPIDVAAANLGHSVAYFTDVYGRLDLTDQIKRFKKAYGMTITTKEAKNMPIDCPTCSTSNTPSRKLCQKCGNPLTMAEALKNKGELDSLKSELARMNKILVALQKESLATK